MTKKMLTLALAFALVNAAAGTGALAASQVEKDAKTLADVKAKVHRAGAGEKARVAVRFKDGRWLKGYIAESREDDFVLRDNKTDTPTTVAFTELNKVVIDRPPLTKTGKAIQGVALGMGVILLVIIVAYAAHPVD